MTFRKMLADRSGGVMPLFALAIVPMIGFIGAAVDFSRANSVKASLQAALDSTALMLSKDAGNLDDAGRQTKAENYIKALFIRPEATNLVVKAPVFSSSGGSQLTISASVDVKAGFMGLVGFPAMHVGSTAMVKWGNNKLRVALALDNTGSMSSNDKMTALKAATKNLLDSLKNAATKDGDVYVSIIPFSKDVNVKTSDTTYTSDWIDWTDWENRNGTCSKNDYHTRNSCVNAGKTWTPAARSTWNGCVMDRDQHNDVKVTTPVAGSTSTLFPAEQFSGCSVSIMPLSYNWTDLNAKVDAMMPTGNTNITIGLAWAWQSLTTGSPLSPPPIDPNDTIPTKKIIILLTDGENTQNRWSSSSGTIDARTELACANAKAADITVYTVLVMQGNATLLKNCATDAKKYFYLTSADQIVTTFDQIGTQLTKLRLAQ